MLNGPPPHGFTAGDWVKLRKDYNIPIPDTPSKRGMTFRECKQLLQDLQSFKTTNDQEMCTALYEHNAKSILEQYKACIDCVQVADFMTTSQPCNDLSVEQLHLRNELIQLIENTLGTQALTQIVTRRNNTIVKRTAELETSPDVEEAEDDRDEEYGSMVYNDINRINFVQRFKYERRQHFAETIKQYQGLQHRTIPQKVYDDLIDMIEKHGLADMTKSTPLERYALITKEHIKMFLRVTEHTQFYEDRMLIFSRITGKPCPSIQKLEKVLFADFDKLVEVFLQLAQTHADLVDRKNFLNTHYVLRQLLRRHNMIVPDDDLNTLKTPARIRTHDDIYQMCCEKLGWNFVPIE